MDVAMLSSEWPMVALLDSASNETESFRQNLRFLVARDYGWLAAELFDIEGELGWGPGNREWDGDFFPPPTDDSYAHMTTFLKTLETVRKDTELTELLREAAEGTCRTQVGKYISCAMNARKTSRGGLIAYFYGKVAECRNTYTLGAARIYLSMWTQQRKYRLALAGLVRLLFHPLNRLAARGETVRRRTHRTFFGAEIVPQRALAVAATVQEVAC